VGVAVAVFDSLQKIMTAIKGHTAVKATPLEPQTALGATLLKIKIRRPAAPSRPTDAEVITRTTYHGAIEAEPLLTLSCRLS
jgi:hypothetical protein